MVLGQIKTLKKIFEYRKREILFIHLQKHKAFLLRMKEPSNKFQNKNWRSTHFCRLELHNAAPYLQPSRLLAVALHRFCDEMIKNMSVNVNSISRIGYLRTFDSYAHQLIHMVGKKTVSFR